MNLYEFIKKYYIDSIVYKQGYNIVNTITWAILLVVSAYLIYNYLKRRINFDLKFMLYTLPYIIFGSSIRVIEDAGFLKPPISYIFMSPLIYILVFFITFPSLILSIKLGNLRIYAYIGIVLAIIPIIILFNSLTIENWWVFPIAITISLIFLFAYTKIQNATSESKLAFFSQMFDGSATFLGIQFLGYWELHVLPRFLVNSFGAWIMIPLKAIVFGILLYYLDLEENIQLANFIKFVIMVLGFAPGIRDALRMSFGV